jgi:hypothetical protein
VLGRDLADDREAETRSGGAPGALGPSEAVEHERDVLGRDAGAVVAHGDLAVPHLDLDLSVVSGPVLI